MVSVGGNGRSKSQTSALGSDEVWQARRAFLRARVVEVLSLYDGPNRCSFHIMPAGHIDNRSEPGSTLDR